MEARVEMLSMAAETLHEAHKLEPADRRIYAKMEEAVAETVFAKRELKKLDDVRGEAAHATVSAAGGEQLHVHAADVDRRRAPSPGRWPGRIRRGRHPALSRQAGRRKVVSAVPDDWRGFS